MDTTYISKRSFYDCKEVTDRVCELMQVEAFGAALPTVSAP